MAHALRIQAKALKLSEKVTGGCAQLRGMWYNTRHQRDHMNILSGNFGGTCHGSSGIYTAGAHRSHKFLCLVRFIRMKECSK